MNEGIYGDLNGRNVANLDQRMPARADAFADRIEWPWDFVTRFMSDDVSGRQPWHRS